MQRTLIKLGGSLLNLPDLAERLEELLSSDVPGPVFLVGGGKAVDLVRDWDTTFRLSSQSAHSLAIQAMGLNAHLLASLSSSIRFSVVNSKGELDAATASGQIPVLDAFDIVRTLEADLSDSRRLPQTWDLTSDSIAAWIAHQWQIPHLLLLKSVSVATIADSPGVSIVDELQAASAVDAMFSEHARHVVHLSWCNLRESPHLIERLW